MKWNALIALFVLVATVLVPAAQSVLAENEVSVFMVDEEKGDTDGKSFNLGEAQLPVYPEWTFELSPIQTYFNRLQLPVDRTVEMPTPPPDPC